MGRKTEGNMRVFWTDPQGNPHEVRVIEQSKKMTVIEYFDNSLRFTTHHRGRRYNHGTRQRIRVYNHELRLEKDGI